VEIEYDDAKSLRNLAERGISFDFAARILLNKTGNVEVEDARRDYGERRIRVTGKIDGRLFVVVYTVRNGRHRIISARKANKRERHAYYQKDP
jgi:uncharacterized protein